MWIPEPGVKFRIFSNHIGQMFCQGNGKTPVCGINLGHKSKKNDYSYYDESWWTLEHSRIAGYYVLIHITSHSRMYANSERGEYGLISTKYYQHDDQLWKIRANDDKDAFQLISYCNGQKLFLRDHARPYIGLCGANVFNYDDQYFCFYFEEPSVESVNFQLNSASFLGKEPKLITQQTISNNSSVTQQQTFNIKYTQVKKHRWEYNGGFKITTGMQMTFKAGIPLFGSTKTTFSVGLETEHRWTTSDVTEESKQMEYSFPVNVPPHKRILAKGFIHEERGEVPYVMKIRMKESGKIIESFGKWQGVQCVHVFHDITEG